MKQYTVDSSLHADPIIGDWLWAIEDARKRTLACAAGLPQTCVDWLPLPDDERAGANSIGTLLYHIALIEADWLCAEVREQPHPDMILELFPIPDRDEKGLLSPVLGIDLKEHLRRLALVRAELLATFRAMDRAEFRRPRKLPDYEVTPQWVLHHLMQHEAEHRAEISALARMAQAR